MSFESRSITETVRLTRQHQVISLPNRWPQLSVSLSAQTVSVSPHSSSIHSETIRALFGNRSKSSAVLVCAVSAIDQASKLSVEAVSSEGRSNSRLRVKVSNPITV